MDKSTPSTKNINNVFVSQIHLTPARAKELLEARFTNRTLSKEHVAKLAKAMREGRWRLTHQGIALNAKGQLIDGQHRCMAVVASGVTIPIWQTQFLGDPPVDVIDIGAKRTAGHILEINGIVAHGKGARHEAMARALDVGLHGKVRNIDEADVAKVVDRFRPEIEWAIALPRKRLLAPQLAAFAFAWPVDKEAISKAAEDVIYRTNLTRRSPLWVLSDHIDSVRESKVNGYSLYVDEFVRTLKALKAHVDHKKIAILKGRVSEGEASVVTQWKEARARRGLAVDSE